ncbi:MAG: hydantoinase/carbamoylase family amidase [Proteobacteria bacterium]|nr:hydantoinase/carbamoylase family amidase [Pseudomonadota bacterium]
MVGLANHLRDEVALADQLFDELRAHTGDPPGVTRASYGAGERYAHARIAALARTLALEVTTDVAGNLYATLPGRDRAAPTVMIGSHLDSVPHGGNYDGAAGVVAGVAALARCRAAGWTPAQDITVMGIRAEELSWFPSHYIGSRAAFGRLPADVLDGCVRFDSGRTLADHMREEGFDPDAVRRGEAHLRRDAIRCYIELHIEQGPALVGAALPVGIVTGIRGNLRYKHCRVLGAYSHAGAVPRQHRRDAVMAATAFVHALEQHWLAREAAGTDFVCTVGQLFTDASQHTMTKIPGEVRFTMDIRSDDNAVLMDTHAELVATAARIAAARRVDIDLGAYMNAPPARMDGDLRALLWERARALDVPAMDMASGAGHDCAVFANEGVPSAMIFVRNDHGSHNPDEAMAIADFAKGLRLLVGLIESLG